MCLGNRAQSDAVADTQEFSLFTRSIALISFFAACLSIPAAANDLNLPDLGGASGGLITASQEYELGQQWQKMFRAQVRTTDDPFIQSYTENLIRNLATYSDLNDKRLDVLVVENPALNAFAVPGGVIGVNTGLFHYAEGEQQFASVMAHELAHLSQRHFARRIDEQKNNSIPNLAAMLASILILATAGGDAGVAAVSASQAAMLDNQLRFSRQMEQEADRIGMATMVRADMNPWAMPQMFESMLHASRFQARPPEFLITHPLTESRVSDSKLRAQQYPRKQEPISLEYQLVRVRAQLAHEKNPSAAAKRFQQELDGHTLREDIARYGLALAQLKARQFDDADRNAALLLERAPDNLYYLVLKSEIEAEQRQFDPAIARLETRLEDYPRNHPLNVKLAEIHMKAGNYARCEALLEAESQRRPKDEYVWYLLAEAHGLAGNIFEVHTARSEYFMLNGIYPKAENHLRLALSMLEDDDRRRPQLEQKLKDIQRLKREMLM